MTYRSMSVHVEASDAERARVRMAASIARLFDARLIGVGARAYYPMPDPIGLSALKLKEMVTADLAAAEAIFRQETTALGAATEWFAETDYPIRALLRHACSADLIIAERGVAVHPPETNAGTASLIMAAGAPVLVAPPGATELNLDSVIIGWKNSREARRAIWDALPFLKHARHVRVVRFSGDETSSMDLEAVVERLRRHGIQAEGECRRRSGGAVADDIVDAAHALSAQLIVVGAYGHSRLQEWALGGVTQHLLARSPVCVLYSH